MNCRNCGTRLNEHEVICPNCGANQNIGAYQNIGVNQSEQVDVDSCLEKAYVGKDYEKLKKSSFSLDILIFGVMHVFYKKMYLLGILWFLILIVVAVTGENLLNYGAIGLNIVLAFTFNKIYLNHVKKNVHKIKLNNPNKSIEELESISKKKGGNSIILMLISLILLVGLLFISSLDKESISLLKSLKNNKETISDLTYMVPKGFVEYHSSDDYKAYDYHTNNTYCTLSIEKTDSSDYGKSYHSLEEYVNYVTNLFENDSSFSISNLKKENINNNEWYTYHDLDNNDYYFIHYEGSDNNYDIELEITNDKMNVFENVVEEFKQSLVLKK